MLQYVLSRGDSCHSCLSLLPLSRLKTRRREATEGDIMRHYGHFAHRFCWGHLTFPPPTPPPPRINLSRREPYGEANLIVEVQNLLR